MKIKLVCNSRITSVLIIFLLILSIFSGFAYGLSVNSINLNDNTRDYIIEFVDKPLYQYITQIKNDYNLKSTINSYKLSLLDSHNTFKDKILSSIDSESKDKIVFSNEFYGIFNGFLIKNLPDELVDSIKELSFVKNVFPNYKFKICLDESVPLINASQLWDMYDKNGNKIRGTGVSIAILDTGVNYLHPDLKDSYAGGYDFFNNDNEPLDDNIDGHGTHCAGILVGNGNSSNGKYVGVAPDADLYVYKILNDKGVATYNEFILGIQAAVDPNDDGDPSDHVDIVSISFGTDKPGSPDDQISSKVDEIVDMGIVVVTAAGNNGTYGDGTITSPGCALKAITVGSVNKNKQISSTSSRGPVEFNGSIYIKPDLVAPGVGIHSTNKDGGYKSLSGTSMAAPHVAGAAALLLQVHPNWTPSMIKNELEKTSEDLGLNGKDNTYGSGLINVYNTINFSSAAPIAVLNIPYAAKKGILKITGFAMNATGDSEDFTNYSIYYSRDSKWNIIYESNNEVKNDILYQWDTTSLESGFYKIKLVVRGGNKSSFEIKDIYIGYEDEKQILISAPSRVYEKNYFNISLTNINKEPVKAIIIFYVPFKLPIIRYGSNVEFRVPEIKNPFLNSLKAQIIVIKITKLRRDKTEISILNDN